LSEVTNSFYAQLIDIFVRKLPPGSYILSDIQERQHFRDSPPFVKFCSKAKKKFLALKRNHIV